MIFRNFSLLLLLMIGWQLGFANEAAVIPVPSAPSQSIRLPAGFKLNVFLDVAKLKGLQVDSPRMMTFDAEGHLFVSFPRQGSVVMFQDANHDGVADEFLVVASKLNAPHGLAFVGEKLYVANQDAIVVLEKHNGRWPAKPPLPIVKDLPTGGHTLKTLKLGPDGLLYVNVGSSCNVCIENHPLRATILRYTTQGKSAGSLVTLGRHAPNPAFAYGLRNAQGFAWHPFSKKMFATNNGADNRSAVKNGKVNDDLPPEHLNQIQAGKHYGWPHCWGNQFADPNFVGTAEFCKSTTSPSMVFPAHSTPIGISFLEGASFSKEYQQDAIVALHGSWNRENPSGYQLVRVKFEHGEPVAIEDFATGWLSNKTAWGRPVDVVVGSDGALYVSDDRAGLIYRVTYEH